MLAAISTKSASELALGQFTHCRIPASAVYGRLRGRAGTNCAETVYHSPLDSRGLWVYPFVFDRIAGMSYRWLQVLAQLEYPTGVSFLREDNESAG